MFRAKPTIKYQKDGDFLQAEVAGTSSMQVLLLSSSHLLIFAMVVAIVGN